MPDPGIQILLWLIAALLVAAGFAGLILPAVPGIPLVFAGLVLLAWVDNFVYVGWITLALLGVLALLSYGIDFLAAALGAKKFGASPRAMAGAALGAVAGLFFGLPGICWGRLSAPSSANSAAGLRLRQRPRRAWGQPWACCSARCSRLPWPSRCWGYSRWIACSSLSFGMLVPIIFLC